MNEPHIPKLRLAYNGDYPGYPCAWINDRPLDPHEERLLIRIMGADEKRGIRGLMEHVGAKPTRCGLECEEWVGGLKFTCQNETLGTEAPRASTENPFPVANCEERLSEPGALSSISDQQLPESNLRCQHLKTWPKYFDAVERGTKTFEIRKNDRPFMVGQKLVLHEYDPDEDSFTGRSLERTISYMTDWEQKQGFVVLGLRSASASHLAPVHRDDHHVSVSPSADKMHPLILQTIDTEGDYERAKGWLRYEVLRTRDIRRFTELVNRNVAGENFDEMVDQIIVEREGL